MQIIFCTFYFCCSYSYRSSIFVFASFFYYFCLLGQDIFTVLLHIKLLLFQLLLSKIFRSFSISKAVTIMGAIQKISKELLPKMAQRRLRTITFTRVIEISQILRYEQFDNTIILLHFGCTNIIFA